MTGDSIRIEGLRVMTVVGVHEWERAAPREIRIDLVLETDLAAAGESDLVADTVDYDTVARVVADRVTPLRARLIERVADEAAQACLAADPRVAAVSVTVHKAGAIPGAADVSVTLRRERV